MKFKVGDSVQCKAYGKGVCKQIDEKNKFLTYDFHFNDGTHIWMAQSRAEKEVSLVK